MGAIFPQHICGESLVAKISNHTKNWFSKYISFQIHVHKNLGLVIC